MTLEGKIAVAGLAVIVIGFFTNVYVIVAGIAILAIAAAVYTNEHE
jgi:hypothetical protein